MAFIFYF